MDCDELRDDQWERLEALVPGGRKGKRGPRADNRRFLNALLWMARSGSRWRDLPARLGDYHTVKRRYYLYGRLSRCKSISNETAWPVANIYPASPKNSGAPKWGIRSRTPLQLVGLEGLGNSQALCAPVRPVQLISPSSRKL